MNTILHEYPCPHGHPLAHLDGYTYERTAWGKRARKALEQAAEDLIRKAGELGAHGVLITELRRRWTLVPTPGDPATAQPGVTGLAVSLLGTAVRRPGAAPLDRPFSASLSGVDLAKALRAGWVPTEAVMTIVCVVVAGGCQTASQRRVGSVGEVVQFGEAMHACGRLVVEDLEARASRGGGEELIGVTMEVGAHEVESPSPWLQGTGTGTAFRPYPSPGPAPALAIMKLRDPGADLAHLVSGQGLDPWKQGGTVPP